MCGIVGMVIKAQNGLIKRTEDIFYEMLFADTLRGDDSTGVIYVENDASFGIMKTADSAAVCVDTIKNHKEMSGMWSSGKALIGHNRKSTIGLSIKQNAHPFVVDKRFAMVHNGTLTNHRALHNTEVDSEALAMHLAPHLTLGFDLEKFEEAMGKVSGAYAIAAFDQPSNKVYLTRNYERPLYLVELPEGWIWASEWGLIVWICSRNGISLEGNWPKLIEPNVLVTIDLDSNEKEEIKYLPKKYTPQVQGITVLGDPTKVRTVKLMETISKNLLKKYRKKFMGKAISMYADDYVEQNFPNTVESGENLIYLLGDSEEISNNNMIQAEFDLHDLDPGDNEFLNCYYRGIVTNIDFDQFGTTLYITLSNLTKTPLSTKVYNEENTLTLH